MIAYLHLQSRYALALRNLCDRIDLECFSVTVFAYATVSSALCRSFAEGTRIIQRDDYTFSNADMEHQAKEPGAPGETQVWKNEILRSLGSDDFDAVLVYNTVNQFRHRFAEYMDSSLRIYATPSESELLTGYYAPDKLASQINETYDKTLLLTGSGTKLIHTEPMPIAFHRSWRELAGQRPVPTVYSDDEKEYIDLSPYPVSQADCTLIPKDSFRRENICCIAADTADAEKLAAMFAEYAADKNDIALFLCVLDGTAETNDKRITVIPGNKISLILLTVCGRFVYPYTGGSGMNFIAAMLGADTAPQAPATDNMLLLAGAPNGNLYTEYEPAPPTGELITDSSIFAPHGQSSFDLEAYEGELTERINSLFTIERQE